MAKEAPDLTGKIFGRLTVVRRFITETNRVSWVCVCVCGNTTKPISPSSLNKGAVNSCGCLRRELAAKAAILRSTTHGLSKHRLYNTWYQMVDRCYNKSKDAYKYYGQRGIKVCDRWLTFKNFIEDMGDCKEGLTLDRIDNNGNYEPSNCRWATSTEQARNTRANISISFNGKVATLAEHCEDLGLKYKIVYQRIYRYMWPVEKALTTKPGAAVKSRSLKVKRHKGICLPENL